MPSLRQKIKRQHSLGNRQRVQALKNKLAMRRRGTGGIAAPASPITTSTAPAAWSPVPQTEGTGVGTGVAAPSPTLPQYGGDDAIYQSRLNALRTKQANQELGFKQQETSTRESFGFDPEYANNPYTRANLLARRASQRYTGTTNSMGARGQFYSGATNRARAADVLTSGQETDEARREYAQKLADVEQQRLGARTEYETGAADAYAELLERLERRELEGGEFDETSDEDSDTGGEGGRGRRRKRGRKKKGGGGKKSGGGGGKKKKR